MSITPFLSLSVLCLGAAIAYFVPEKKKQEKKKQDKNVVGLNIEQTKNEVENSPQKFLFCITPERLEKCLLAIKKVNTALKYSKTIIQQVKNISGFRITPESLSRLIRSEISMKNLSKLIRSPKFIENMILGLGTIGMVYSNFKPFKGQPSFFSKATTIGGSLLAESKDILTMHKLMLGISDLAKNRKPPIKELTIASVMILGSYLANRYSK